jgi:hypothetical protein
MRNLYKYIQGQIDLIIYSLKNLQNIFTNNKIKNQTIYISEHTSIERSITFYTYESEFKLLTFHPTSKNHFHKLSSFDRHVLIWTTLSSGPPW